MSTPARWPLHPAPRPGQALTCWLGDLAAAYHLSRGQLLEHLAPRPQDGWGDLDADAPAGLLDALAQRTGVPLARLEQMSLGGWTPWLFDSLEPGDFDLYVHQFSVLLPPGRRRRPERPWRPWLGQPPLRRACPRCAVQPGGAYRMLLDALPLTLTCPLHRVALAPCFHLPDRIVFDEDVAPGLTGTPDAAVVAMDALTHQALTCGRVVLAGREVHAGVWLRMLRAVIDEVSLPSSTWPTCRQDLHAVWEASGQPPRAGLGHWRAYEDLAWSTQVSVLRAAASAIDLLSTGQVRGRGEDADLLTPTPAVWIDDGRALTAAPAVTAWDEVVSSLDSCVTAAQTDPVRAQQFFELLCFGCHTPAARARVLVDLALAGVPTTGLTYNHRGVPVHVN